MIYRRSRTRGRIPGGFFRFEQEHSKARVYGFGYGDYIRLRDEYGNMWRGSAERMADDSVLYRFRDSQGRTITGVSDSFGMILRDDKGKTWRGFID